MTIAYVVYTLFFGSILLQLFYLLLVFPRLIRHRDYEIPTESAKWPSVSIVIAAMNELENLKELLPLLEQQDYPDFEIVIADDRSSDGTYDFLLNNEDGFRRVRFSRITETPAHFTAKKYAMTVAIKRAKNDLILTTDADCRPESEQWMKRMVTQLSADEDVVLGVSPYYIYPGLLNAFIRYETFQTAVQYLSFALAKIPFMGVGRNLLFRRSLFWQTNGYIRHADLLSGDDDLFINEASTPRNVAVATDLPAYTFSEPKRTLDAWITQKRRHLSVGKRYKLRDKITIGSLWVSLLSAWILFLPTFFIQPPFPVNLPEWLIIPNDWLGQFGLKHWEPLTNWMRIAGLTFLGWQGIRWAVLAGCNRRLSYTVTSWKIPYYDFLYVLYLIVFGMITLLSNPKKLKWK